MTDVSKRTRFTSVQRVLHWLMAIGILSMLFIGVAMVSTIGRQYVPLLVTHKTLGIILLILALVRLTIRFMSGAPPLPIDLPEPMKLAAQLSHVGLYILMIGMPLIGWAMLSAAAYPIVLYGGFRVPAILPQNAMLHALLWNAHSYLAFAFFALVLMHLAAGLYHGLVRRDGVLQTMLPGR
ncbi:cytochrome b [Rhizobium sp.]|uniref:cytochrome b n=1 Tax=Rhizobium sp. TaxID=391 RepID=UPI0034C64B29